ncbi:MAG: hypothetical protein H3C34_00880 [Caldilineaceae bacterium]|nr:hypothetical protein [Caldilineaceae bacterium]
MRKPVDKLDKGTGAHDNGMTVQQQLTLEACQRMLDTRIQTGEHLDNKAATILQAGSLIIALFGATSVPTMMYSQGSVGLTWVYVPVTLVFGMFLAMVFVSLRAWNPSEHEIPGTTDWNQIVNGYLSVSIVDCYDQILSDLLQSIESNKRRNEKKACYVTMSIVLLGLQVLVILVTAVFIWWTS